MGTSDELRDRKNLVDGMAATPGLLEAATRDVADTALDAAPTGEWSVRTILAHLRDDEFMVMRLRLERMLVEDNPTLAPFDEKAWAAARWTGRDGLDELLSDFRIQHEASMMLLHRLQDADWQRTGFQPEYGQFDVHWWLNHWLEHDELHIAQIQSTLAFAGNQPTATGGGSSVK